MVRHELELTGERYVPWWKDYQTGYEHIHRYLFALPFAEGKRVLDIACGEGYGLAMLAQVADSVVGADLNLATLRHAAIQHRRPNLGLFRADAQHFALAGGAIDLVVSFETIEHFQEQRSFLQGVKQALTTDGILIISTPDRQIFDELGRVNHFHQRELFRTEFVSLLRDYFRHVQLYGERCIVGTVISSDQEGVLFRHSDEIHCLFTDVQPDALEYPITQESRLRPTYYLAVCSDTIILPPRPSLMVDNSQTLWHHLAQNVRSLQREIRVLQILLERTRMKLTATRHTPDSPQ